MHLKQFLIACFFCCYFFLDAKTGTNLYLTSLEDEELVSNHLATSPLPVTKQRIQFLLDALTQYGILDSKDDWFNQITSTDPCKGEIIGTLLLQLGRSFRTISTFNGAIAILKMRIYNFQSAYWLSHAISGEQCQLNYVLQLLEQMVADLPIPISIPPSVNATPLKAIDPGSVNAKYDIVVAGAGSGGCGVAIQAARMGCSVLLLEETDWVGGQITAAGVSTMDEGSHFVEERGLYRELCGHILAYYQPLGINPVHPYGRYCIEPKIAHQILLKLLGDAASPQAQGQTRTLDLLLYTTVTRVLKEGDLVTGVEITTNQNGVVHTQTISSKILVDATEWGDVIPLIGARYRVGNCTSDSLNMQPEIQDLTWTATLKYYPDGVPPDLLIKTPPPNYTEALSDFQQTIYLGGPEDFNRKLPWSWQTFIGYRAIPNSLPPDNTHTITCAQMNFQNDVITHVGDIEDIKQRKLICLAALYRTLNLIYYIQSTLQPNWAIAMDQGYDTPYQHEQIDALIVAHPELSPYRSMLYHFSTIPYVRESRRMMGLHTLTAREIARVPGPPLQFPHTIALADYYMDLHGSREPQYIELDLDRPEDLAFGGSGPFSIPFECFIPEIIDGFLPAEKNFSQSRLVNGATRMQPSTLLMGQAVGAIAALSIKQGVQPRMLDPSVVQSVLLDEGCTLSIKHPKSAWGTPQWKQENLQAL